MERLIAPDETNVESRDQSQDGTSIENRNPQAIIPAGTDDSTCPSCGVKAGGTQPQPASYVYAIGRIEPRFPRLSIEKEFAQVTGRDNTKGLSDRQVLHAVLSKKENRYLARQIVWVMTIGGLATYILLPRDPADLALLVESLRPDPDPSDLDVLIGLKGPIAPPEMCNGLMVPIVIFEQIYSFDRDTLIKAIPKPEKMNSKEFVAAAEELFDRIMLMTDNAGATDGDRALNYLAVRYHRVYEAVAEAFARNEFLSGIEVQSSRLSGVRNVVDVIFARVDVTECFPFLMTKMTPYYDH
jgi:hypothetical protein